MVRNNHTLKETNSSYVRITETHGFRSLETSNCEIITTKYKMC